MAWVVGGKWPEWRQQPVWVGIMACVGDRMAWEEGNGLGCGATGGWENHQVVYTPSLRRWAQMHQPLDEPVKAQVGCRHLAIELL